MGSMTMIEILFSALVGAMILLIMLRVNANTTKNGFDIVENLSNVKLIEEIDSTLNYSFNQFGYLPGGVPDTMISFIFHADSERIKFIGEFDIKDLTSDFDTCEYFLGLTSELYETPNPKDRILYKKLSGCEDVNMDGIYIESTNITDFQFLYLSKTYDTLATRDSTAGNIIIKQLVPKKELPDIYDILISFKIENSYGYDVDNANLESTDITKKGYAEGYYKKSMIPTKLSHKN
jgi:hypothetical protein